MTDNDDRKWRLTWVARGCDPVSVVVDSHARAKLHADVVMADPDGVFYVTGVTGDDLYLHKGQLAWFSLEEVKT